jgi:NAD(P)-dependent dehydrogenase (short-subunit alcohol dehydrogenase family)
VTNLACDLSKEAAIASACATLEQVVAGCSEVALVHNASQMLKDRANDCSSDKLRQVMQTNVIGVNSINQRLLPLLPGTSSVLYVGSTLAEKAVPGAFSYIVSKHAQLGMMRATCQDLMGSGIHTAMICPGFTDTEMLRAHLGSDPDVTAAVAGMNSFNRLIAPEEIAELIRWAHHNPVINGAVLHANLGQKES